MARKRLEKTERRESFSVSLKGKEINWLGGIEKCQAICKKALEDELKNLEV